MGAQNSKVKAEGGSAVAMSRLSSDEINPDVERDERIKISRMRPNERAKYLKAKRLKEIEAQISALTAEKEKLEGSEAGLTKEKKVSEQNKFSKRASFDFLTKDVSASDNDSDSETDLMDVFRAM